MHLTDSSPGGKMPQQQFTITLTDAGGDPRPIACRLKQLLKWALRILRLRCVAATGIDPEAVQS